jgi:lipid-binding SYLF domain-containing protein
MNASNNSVRAARPFLLCLLMLTVGLAVAASPDDSRAKVRKQSQEVLARLYAAEPSARDVIASSRGYATFSRWGLTMGPVGGGIGRGLVVARPSGNETFMRFVEGSAGMGLGIKKYDVIFVFQNENALNDFVTKGWQAGGQGTLAAKNRVGGRAVDGAVSVSPGVWVYQNTSKGLAAELGIKGTKYYTDKSLN